MRIGKEMRTACLNSSSKNITAFLKWIQEILHASLSIFEKLVTNYISKRCGNYWSWILLNSSPVLREKNKFIDWALLENNENKQNTLLEKQELLLRF